MSILVVGSVALDTIRTPFGYVCEALGGSAVYFSVAARFFTDVHLVAVVGRDFPDEHVRFLENRGVDMKGLKKVDGKTFRWEGEYLFDLNEAKTIRTELNVFQDFRPVIPEEYRHADHVFLANIDPELQLEVLKQVKNPSLVACDTMNYWIRGKPQELKNTLKTVDIVFLNEQEARELAGEANLIKAAKYIHALGPSVVVIKRGEYGALLFQNEKIFWAPAYPLETIFDPTGAGDSFAGGFMGYLCRDRHIEKGTYKKGIVYGSIMASFNVEDFSVRRIASVTFADIERRYQEFKNLTSFEDILIQVS